MTKILVPLGVREVPQWVKDLLAAGLEEVWQRITEGEYWMRFIPSSDARAYLFLGEQYVITVNDGVYWLEINSPKNTFRVTEAADVVTAIRLDHRMRLNTQIYNEISAFVQSQPYQANEAVAQLEKLSDEIFDQNEDLYRQFEEIVEQVGAPKKRSRKG